MLQNFVVFQSLEGIQVGTMRYIQTDLAGKRRSTKLPEERITSYIQEYATGQENKTCGGTPVEFISRSECHWPDIPSRKKPSMFDGRAIPMEHASQVYYSEHSVLSRRIHSPTSPVAAGSHMVIHSIPPVLRHRLL